MDFIADESVDQPIVDYLRKNNYTVIAIAEMDPGLPDKQVFDIADKSNAILIAADKLTLVTRNEKDFTATGIEVITPGIKYGHA